MEGGHRGLSDSSSAGAATERVRQNQGGEVGRNHGANQGSVLRAKDEGLRAHEAVGNDIHLRRL